MGKETAHIRDQLGSDPDTFPVPVFGYYENLEVQELSTIVSTNTIGTSFILGHPTNGVLGTSTLGSHGRVLTRVRVVNPDKKFNEHFRDTLFKDTDSTNTANWDTESYRLAAGTAEAPISATGSTATFLPIAIEDGTISKVRVTKGGGTAYLTDTITYYVKAEDSAALQEITEDTETALSTPGTALTLVVEFQGTGGSATYVEDLKVEYQ